MDDKIELHLPIANDSRTYAPFPIKNKNIYYDEQDKIDTRISH